MAPTTTLCVIDGLMTAVGQSWAPRTGQFADRVTRSAIATGAYYAVASSIVRAGEPFPTTRARAHGRLDNRSRNYSMPARWRVLRRAVDGPEARADGIDPAAPAFREGVQRRSLVRQGRRQGAGCQLRHQGAAGLTRLKGEERGRPDEGLQRAIKIVPATEGEDELGVRRADATWERMLTEVEALVELPTRTS